ncbi:MAG TPA: tetratricopeptide repeat-containing glycosyltransferase family protein [Methylovirgula sp.]|nr:tetratricopeptide repeat-containing glycosyltransferase family protein [Methylovirgula sp.]
MAPVSNLASAERPPHSTLPFSDALFDAALNAAAEDLRGGRPVLARDRLAAFDPALGKSLERCQLAGLILIGTKALTEALAWFAQARALNPAHAGAARFMGAALQGLGRNEEALKAYDDALRLGLMDETAFYDRGLVLCALGRKDEAIASFDEALRLKPAYPEALRTGASLLSEAGLFESALEFLEEALRLKPEFFEAHLDRGNLLRQLDSLEGALRAYSEALEIFPGNPDLCNNRGVTLQNLGDLEAARASFDLALASEPRFPEALFNLGTLLLKLASPEEALALFDRALAVSPDHVAAFVGRGVALKEMGEFDAAAASFDAALARDPNSAHAKNNKGALQLLRGDFANGWEGYEYRWITGLTPKAKLEFPIPEWRGTLESGEKVIVYDEQGFGDTIQFCRYLPLIAKAGVDLTFFCRSSLLRLMRGLDIRCVNDLGPDEKFDSQIALVSLPRVLKTRLDCVPSPVPYLSPEPELVETWARRLKGGEFKIGLCWHGNPDLRADPGRSIPLALFKPLARDGVRLVSLQRRDGLDELKSVPFEIETLGEDFDAGPDAFVDTAAVMQNLDLIVSCDTSVAHVAGALGRPVFVLLKQVPDWRWLLEREDSPWYPTMRLFRQKARDNWSEAIARVGAAIDRMRSPL